jgi:uncharacterized membrane protein
MGLSIRLETAKLTTGFGSSARGGRQLHAGKALKAHAPSAWLEKSHRAHAGILAGELRLVSALSSGPAPACVRVARVSETTTMNEDRAPLSLVELRKLLPQVRSVNDEQKKALSRLDRLAVWTTERVGTMGFCLMLLAWTVAWLGWNTAAPRALRFDPYPAFVLWLFLSNMIQICLMPLIMLGQNLQGRHAEARAEADFTVNTKAEREIETILLHLERQSDLMLRILHRLEDMPKQ